MTDSEKNGQVAEAIKMVLDLQDLACADFLNQALYFWTAGENATGNLYHELATKMVGRRWDMARRFLALGGALEGVELHRPAALAASV